MSEFSKLKRHGVPRKKQLGIPAKIHREPSGCVHGSDIMLCFKKLKNQKGASIIVSLLFFIICATVGMSVLSAANANSSRILSQQKSEESYLAVRSAAMLTEKTLKDIPVAENIIKKTVTTTPSATPGGPDTVTTEYEAVYGSGSYTFNGYQKEFLNILVNTGTPALIGDSAAVKAVEKLAKDTGEKYFMVQAPHMDDVLVTCVIFRVIDDPIDTFNVKLVFTIKNNTAYNSKMTLELIGRLREISVDTSTANKVITLYGLEWLDMSYKNGE